MRKAIVTGGTGQDGSYLFELFLALSHRLRRQSSSLNTDLVPFREEELWNGRVSANGIIAATEAYDQSHPANLGSGIVFSIRDLADKVMKFVVGRSVSGASQPDDRPRRYVNVSHAHRNSDSEHKLHVCGERLLGA